MVFGAYPQVDLIFALIPHCYSMDKGRHLLPFPCLFAQPLEQWSALNVYPEILSIDLLALVLFSGKLVMRIVAFLRAYYMASTRLNVFHLLFNVFLTATLFGRDCYYLTFIGKETET